jgi:hypothetical protein
MLQNEERPPNIKDRCKYIFKNFRLRKRGDIHVCKLGYVLRIPQCKSVPDYEIFHKISDEVVGCSEWGNELLGFIHGRNFLNI